MVSGLAALPIAGIAFCASHVVLSSTRWRGVLREQLGERGFLILYSVTAAVTLAWFISAYHAAPYIGLWGPRRWTGLVPVAIMPLATILLVAGYTTRNPTAVGMERSARADDPAPGILRVTRHPVMWAVGLWGLSHVVANGDVASLIFFGLLAGLALGGSVLIDRKKRLALGSHWSRLAAITSNVPFAALFARRTALRWRDIGALRIIAGLLLYAVLYLAHPLITGMPVLILR
jgi:uncharacterized membrane protein